MSSSIKSEIVKVLALALPLALGIGYLSLVDTAEPARSNGVLSMYADASTVDSLKLVLEGRAVPALNANNILKGQRDSINVAAVGLIIPIPGNACIQRQVGALKRIQALHDAIGEDVPVQVLLMTDFGIEATRMQTLLLRKALRPTYELWYTNDVNPLSRTILQGQLEPVLVISDQTVNSVFHAVEHNRVVHTVSELLGLPTSLRRQDTQGG